uniref:Ig-like domain-containing protein n=1 Tax=Callorhinchus milii TaxID=7868 RepID=A0A4W3GEZ2_CALMI
FVHSTLLCVTLLCLNKLCGGDTVSQKAATIVWKEGDAVTFNCTFSTNESAFFLFWYRQYPYKQPEFMVWRFSYNNKETKGAAIGSRFSSQLDIIQSVTSLSISELQVSDTAMYLCATASYKNYPGCVSLVFPTDQLRLFRVRFCVQRTSGETTFTTSQYFC